MQLQRRLVAGVDIEGGGAAGEVGDELLDAERAVLAALQVQDVDGVSALVIAPERSGVTAELGHLSGAVAEVVSQPSRLGSTTFSIRTSGTAAPPVASASRLSGRNPYAV